MGKKNPFRRFVICLVNWPPFDWLMLLFIVANCITLALYTNDPGFQETKLYTNLVLADFVFVSAFTVEMVIKILALGLLFEGHGTYLLNGWNVFDCAVVIIGWITLLTTLDNYTFLRAFRILRPLRLITIIPALRRIMKATFAAIPMMNNVFILSLFYFSVFGIICLQLFQGKLLYHCGSPDFTYAYSEDINGVSYIRNVSYTFEGRDSINCKGPMASDYQWTNTTGTPFLLADFQPAGGNQWGYVCPFRSSDFSESDLQSYPYGTYCAPYLNPELGYRSFDNILYAWLMVYQHLMVNDWSLPMYSTQQTASWWTWLLDATMIVLGLYLIVKLTVAVLFLGFSRSYGGEETDKNEEVVADGQGQIHTDDGSDPTIAQALDACDRPSFILRKAQLFNEEESWGRGRRVWESFRDVCFVIQGNKWFQNFTVVVIIINAASMAIQWTDMPQLAVLATTYANYAVTMYFGELRLIGCEIYPSEIVFLYSAGNGHQAYRTRLNFIPLRQVQHLRWPCDSCWRCRDDLVLFASELCFCRCECAPRPAPAARLPPCSQLAQLATHHHCPHDLCGGCRMAHTSSWDLLIHNWTDWTDTFWKQTESVLH